MAQFGPEVNWLTGADAQVAYRRAVARSSKARFGLDEATFGHSRKG